MAGADAEMQMQMQNTKSRATDNSKFKVQSEPRNII